MCGDRATLSTHLKQVCDTGVATFVSLQSKNESDPYHHAVGRLLGDAAKFMSLPIPDQQTTDDGRVAALVISLLRRVLDGGEVLYVHCRGGHGRTGTVCSILLGALYNLDGPAALSTFQALHDVRAQPCFATHDYTVTPSGKACVSLFPEQREQVLRLLGSSCAAGAADEEDAGAGVGDEAPLAPPTASKSSLSETYGSGASKYDEDVLVEWRQRGLRAAEAAKRKDWVEATAEFAACVSLRDDWQKGHVCLERARAQAQAAEEKRRQAREPADVPLPLATEGGVRAVQSIDGGEPATAAQATRAPPLGTHVPTLVMLVGLPGSGKSTFAKALGASRDEWTIIDSDELGGRRATEAAVSSACRALAEGVRPEAREEARVRRPGSRLIVDRCHVRLADRADMLELALPFLPRGTTAPAGRGGKGAGRSKGNAAAAASTSPVVCAVYFATPADVCVERVAGRTDHPSIPYGHGRPAVEAMAKAMQLPQPVEAAAAAALGSVGGGPNGGGDGDGDGPVAGALSPAFVEAEGVRWCIVRSATEANTLLTSWRAAPVAHAPPAGFFKFPRTRHVLNTGGTAVTRDDLVMDVGRAGRFFDGRTVVVAEEKVDGANLGFSLSRNYEIRAQNRSHYVNEHTHGQFKPLPSWLDVHGWALCQLLEPEVEVLFGEWLVARHSVRYSRLPGHFVAFDIYNKRTGTFASAAERNRRLRGLGIPVVRTLARRAMNSKDDLLALLELRSGYGDGFVEGAYLRIDSDAQQEQAVGEAAARLEVGAEDESAPSRKVDPALPRNALRGKLVRPDFIQGIEDHWMGRSIELNGLRPDLWQENDQGEMEPLEPVE